MQEHNDQRQREGDPGSVITVYEGWSPDMRAKADGFQGVGEGGKALEEAIQIKGVTHSISSQGI